MYCECVQICSQPSWRRTDLNVSFSREKRMKKKNIINMTEGKSLPVITAFALPMILSNLFQLLYNVIDSVIVGNWLGMKSFAAVGCTGMVTAVLVQVSTGLSLGGSIVVSQLFGAGKQEEIRTCTTTLAIFMTGLAVFVTAGCCPSTC